MPQGINLPDLLKDNRQALIRIKELELALEEEKALRKQAVVQLHSQISDFRAVLANRTKQRDLWRDKARKQADANEVRLGLKVDLEKSFDLHERDIQKLAHLVESGATDRIMLRGQTLTFWLECWFAGHHPYARKHGRGLVPRPKSRKIREPVPIPKDELWKLTYVSGGKLIRAGFLVGVIG